MGRRLQRRRRPRAGEQGFTLIEVLIALLILLVGIAGILTLQTTAVRATAVSRHATEASVVAEEKLEALRLGAPLSLASGTDVVDSRGIADPNGTYTRTWTITNNGDTASVVVDVAWTERGSEMYSISVAGKRSL